MNKGYTENWPKEMFAIDSLLKTNRLTYKIRNLNGETIIIISFYEKRIVEYIINELLSRT